MREVSKKITKYFVSWKEEEDFGHEHTGKASHGCIGVAGGAFEQLPRLYAMKVSRSNVRAWRLCSPLLLNVAWRAEVCLHCKRTTGSQKPHGDCSCCCIRISGSGTTTTTTATKIVRQQEELLNRDSNRISAQNIPARQQGL